MEQKKSKLQQSRGCCVHVPAEGSATQWCHCDVILCTGACHSGFKNSGENVCSKLAYGLY